jgi:hypothetical protein
MIRQVVQVVFSAFVLACIAGCGGGPSVPKDRTATTKVSGKVVFKGQPLEGATVSLMSPTGGPAAIGITDASGGYKLTTFDKDDGTVPGEYKVTIRKMDKAVSSGVSMDDPNYNPDAPVVPPRSLIPEKYGDQLKSGLTATIGKDAKTDLNFTLE